MHATLIGTEVTKFVRDVQNLAWGLPGMERLPVGAGESDRARLRGACHKETRGMDLLAQNQASLRRKSTHAQIGVV